MTALVAPVFVAAVVVGALYVRAYRRRMAAISAYRARLNERLERVGEDVGYELLRWRSTLPYDQEDEVRLPDVWSVKVPDRPLSLIRGGS